MTRTAALRDFVRGHFREFSGARDNLPEAAAPLAGIAAGMAADPGHYPRNSSRLRARVSRTRFKNWWLEAAYEEALNFRISDAFVHQALGFAQYSGRSMSTPGCAPLEIHSDFTRLVHIQRVM